MPEIVNKSQNYTTDVTTSKPDSRLHTFIGNMNQLKQIYSVDPLEYTDIVGEYWQRINDIIFALGLTENQNVSTNIGWTVPIIGKKRSDLVTEKLGAYTLDGALKPAYTLNNEGYPVPSANYNPSTNTYVHKEYNASNIEAPDSHLTSVYGTGKTEAHRYGLIQTIDWMFQRNINTWGNLYDYFYDNLNIGVHPVDLGKMLFGPTFTSDNDIDSYYYLNDNGEKVYINQIFDSENGGDLTTGGIGSEVVKLINIIDKDLYDWFNNENRHCLYNPDEIGPSTIKELFFDNATDEEMCELFSRLTTGGVINETVKLIDTIGEDFYYWLNEEKDCIFSYDEDGKSSGPQNLEQLFFDDWPKNGSLTPPNPSWCEYFNGLISKGLLVETYNIVKYLGDDYYNYVNYINNQKNPNDPNNPANPSNPDYVEYDPYSNPLFVLAKIDIGQVLYGNKKTGENGKSYTVYENSWINREGYICENDYEVGLVKESAGDQLKIFNNFKKFSHGTTNNTANGFTRASLFSTKNEVPTVVTNNYTIRNIETYQIYNCYSPGFNIGANVLGSSNSQYYILPGTVSYGHVSKGDDTYPIYTIEEVKKETGNNYYSIQNVDGVTQFNIGSTTYTIKDKQIVYNGNTIDIISDTFNIGNNEYEIIGNSITCTNNDDIPTIEINEENKFELNGIIGTLNPKRVETPTKSYPIINNKFSVGNTTYLFVYTETFEINGTQYLIRNNSVINGNTSVAIKNDNTFTISSGTNAGTYTVVKTNISNLIDRYEITENNNISGVFYGIVNLRQYPIEILNSSLGSSNNGYIGNYKIKKLDTINYNTESVQYGTIEVGSQNVYININNNSASLANGIGVFYKNDTFYAIENDYVTYSGNNSKINKKNAFKIGSIYYKHLETDTENIIKTAFNDSTPIEITDNIFKIGTVNYILHSNNVTEKNSTYEIEDNQFIIPSGTNAGTYKITGINLNKFNSIDITNNIFSFDGKNYIIEENENILYIYKIEDTVDNSNNFTLNGIDYNISEYTDSGTNITTISSINFIDDVTTITDNTFELNGIPYTIENNNVTDGTNTYPINNSIFEINGKNYLIDGNSIKQQTIVTTNTNTFNINDDYYIIIKSNNKIYITSLINSANNNKFKIDSDIDCTLILNENDQFIKVETLTYLCEITDNIFELNSQNYTIYENYIALSNKVYELYDSFDISNETHILLNDTILKNETSYSIIKTFNVTTSNGSSIVTINSITYNISSDSDGTYFIVPGSLINVYFNENANITINNVRYTLNKNLELESDLKYELTKTTSALIETVNFGAFSVDNARFTVDVSRFTYKTYFTSGNKTYIVFYYGTSTITPITDLTLVVEFDSAYKIASNKVTTDYISLNSLGSIGNLGSLSFYAEDNYNSKTSTKQFACWFYYWDFLNYVKNIVEEKYSLHAKYFSYVISNINQFVPEIIKQAGFTVTTTCKKGIPETRSWNYDTETSTIKIGFNSTTWLSLLSDKKYEDFYFECMPCSNNDDDDFIGIVISSYTDFTTGLTHILHISRVWSYLGLFYDDARIAYIGTIHNGIVKPFTKPNSNMLDGNHFTKNGKVNANDIAFLYDTTIGNTIAEQAYNKFKAYGNNVPPKDSYYITRGPTSYGICDSVESGIIDADGNYLKQNYCNVPKTVKYFIEEVHNGANVIRVKPYASDYTREFEDLTSTFASLYNRRNNLTIADINTLMYSGNIIRLGTINNGVFTQRSGNKNICYINSYGALNCAGKNYLNTANNKFKVTRTKSAGSDTYEIDIKYKDILTEDITGNYIDIKLSISADKKSLKLDVTVPTSITGTNTVNTSPSKTITSNISSIVRMFTEPTSYGYINNSNPLTEYRNIEFVDMSGAEIYDVENNKIYKSTYNNLLEKWSYEIDYDTNKDVLQTIIDKYHFGRYITNTVTGKTFFISKEIENLVKIVDPINIDFNGSGLELDSVTNKLSVKTNVNNGVIINGSNEVDLNFIKEDTEKGIHFNKSIYLHSKKTGNIDNWTDGHSIHGDDNTNEIAILSDPYHSDTNIAIEGSAIYLHASKCVQHKNLNGALSNAIPGQFIIRASAREYDTSDSLKTKFISNGIILTKQLSGTPAGDLVWNGSAMQITSDERKKTNITNISEKVLEAWKEVNWIQFNYKEELTNPAMKLHTGLIAQKINAVFEKHGLNATDYGLVAFDKNSDLWTVRYEEAQAIEAAYQRKRADELEKRIEKLELLMAGNK